jgi:hypothetical protein
MRFREVKIVHCAGDIEVGVGIETVGKGQPLMPKIGFDLEIRVEAERLGVAVLQAAAELRGEPFFG